MRYVCDGLIDDTVTEKTHWRGTFNSMGAPVLERCSSDASSTLKAETFEDAKHKFASHLRTCAAVEVREAHVRALRLEKEAKEVEALREPE